MDLWIIILIVFLVGCAGGLVNALISGELQLPGKDTGANVFRPGWVGNVIIGGTASVVFYGLYGPHAQSVLLGGNQALKASMTVGELFGSVITGMGGGRLLMSQVDKRALENQNTALLEVRDSLTQSLAKLAGDHEE